MRFVVLIKLLYYVINERYIPANQAIQYLPYCQLHQRDPLGQVDQFYHDVLADHGHLFLPKI